MTHIFDPATPERHLDFWLGEWRVSWEGGSGTNTITRDHDGHVIRESFDARSALDFRGESLSVYDAKRKLWRQTWVDTDGDYWAFEGGSTLVDDKSAFVLETDDVVDGEAVKLRMVFFDIAEDGMNWRWESSKDTGNSWTLRWLIRYSRA